MSTAKKERPSATTSRISKAAAAKAATKSEPEQKRRKTIVRKAGAPRQGSLFPNGVEAKGVEAKGVEAKSSVAKEKSSAAEAKSSNGVTAPPPKKPTIVRRRPRGEGPNAKSQLIEVNPKLESTRGRLPKAQGQTGGAKPLTFAERQRAEAEAMFQQIAPKWKDEAPPPPPSTGQPNVRQSEFEIRVSERDSLTTALRMEQDKRKSLALANKLADQFKLPPDQGVLTKVISLDDERLTLLALEELLELDDRGRVRRSDDLVEVIQGARGKNPEIGELRGLLLEKLGVSNV
ncbi:MAG: hypothetical protein AAFN74_08965 [Myxococcota bacterium]